MFVSWMWLNSLFGATPRQLETALFAQDAGPPNYLLVVVVKPATALAQINVSQTEFATMLAHLLNTAQDFAWVQINAHRTRSKHAMSGEKSGGNWFEAMADAWGSALNDQAERIVTQADQVANGMDTPAEITQLTAESLRMNFISNSSHTSLTSVGSALETLARKQ